MDFSADLSKLYLLCAITPCLLVLCWYDCKYRRLPNIMTLGLAALALLGRVFTGGMAGFFDGLIGGLLCGFFLFIPFLMKSAGGGDVKMLFAAGIVVGLRFSFVELLFVSVSGLVLGVVMLCFGLVGSRRLIHYARVLFDWRYDRKKGAAGLPPKQDEKGRIPFGVAIASGTLATLIYSFLLEVH